MQVTWWELEELLETFRSYPSDHFEQLAPNMWLRSGSREGPPVPWYGIAIVPPRAHKYGCAALRTSLIDQSRPNVDLEWLVLKFTSYNIRLRITEAMVEELKCDQRTATLMGIGLSYIALVSSDPNSEESIMAEQDGVDAIQERTRLLHSPGNGWTRLVRTHRTAVKCRVSVKAHDDTGFGSLLVGFLRPIDGRPETLDGMFPSHETEDSREDVVDVLSAEPALPFPKEEVTNEPSDLQSVPVLSEVPDSVPVPDNGGTEERADSGGPDEVSRNHGDNDEGGEVRVGGDGVSLPGDQR